MSTSEIAPSWHPDPANPSESLRWWDGARWTDHTQPARVASGGPDTTFGTQPSAPRGVNDTSSWSGVPGSDPRTAASRHSFDRASGNLSFAHQNQRSLTAIGFAALYVVLALATHVVFLGIVPAMAAYRGIQRKEPLAWAGVAAAAVAIAVSVAGFS